MATDSVVAVVGLVDSVLDGAGPWVALLRRFPLFAEQEIKRLIPRALKLRRPALLRCLLRNRLAWLEQPLDGEHTIVPELPPRAVTTAWQVDAQPPPHARLGGREEGRDEEGGRRRRGDSIAASKQISALALAPTTANSDVSAKGEQPRGRDE